ncbi:hypothetical protein BRADI_3g43725v3 [Brachypodium distachyon]|uniref:Uncharacterized protein n=1 Tax=Brachypodium distachyon TaxID=15368 RepID=A0A2K2D2Z6_BRADI|nr:hypothetical protein BRADI_3g43725v3 [Brachypodium distachyon]
MLLGAVWPTLSFLLLLLGWCSIIVLLSTIFILESITPSDLCHNNWWFHGSLDSDC